MPIKKPKTITPTKKQRLAMKHLLDKRGSVGEAMRAAGYSAATVKNPANFTRSKAYSEILKAAGATDELLAKKQYNLLSSANRGMEHFPAALEEETITHSPSGRKLRKPVTHKKWIQVSDEKIKAMIEEVPGHKLLYIQKGTYEKIAHYQFPNSMVQSKQVELALKVRGHFAAEKLEVLTHELTDEEAEMLNEING